jgi:Carboxylesterase type B
VAGLIALIGAFSASAVTAANEVTVAGGKLQGTTNQDHTVRMFKGIPFAAAPVGALRWKAPQPAPGWNGVRQADNFGPACLQTDVFGDIYFRDAQPSEDCLNLDIWIPAKAQSAKIPVFVGFMAAGSWPGAHRKCGTTGRIWRRRE